MLARLGAVTAGLLLLAVPSVLAQAPQGPEGLHLAYGSQPSTLTVTFSGPPATEASVVLVEPEERSIAAEPEPLPGDDEVVYRAELTGLTPATAYTYRAHLDGQASQELPFRTAPSAESEEPVRITGFGDQGVPAPAPHLDRADGDAPLENSELVARLEPDVHLLAGDISYADGDPGIWDIYFRENQPFWGTTPFMTVPGNHEREAGQGYAQYDARLTMPEATDPGRWWTTQVGNVQLVGLNSDTICTESQAVQVVPTASYYCSAGREEAREPNERQLAFVEETLAAAEQDGSVDWTIVTYHNPTYSTGGHGSNPDVQALWVPLFEEHGVDLVLNGDDHLYQRTKTLQGGEPAEEGPVYVVNGLGGSDTYTFQDEGQPPPWEAHRFNDDYGTLVVDAYEDRLEGRFLTLNGTSVDEFTLAGGANGSPTLVDQSTEANRSESAAGNGSATEEGADETPGPTTLAVVLAAASAALAAGRRRRHA